MDEMVTYLTTKQVLDRVLNLQDKTMESIVSIRIDAIIEAMKQYHNQFDNPQYVPTPPPPVLTLEEKILEAKGYGIRFIEASPTGQYIDTHDAIIITDGLTTEGFEEELDEKIQYYRDRVFMDILKKHDLLK